VTAKSALLDWVISMSAATLAPVPNKPEDTSPNGGQSSDKKCLAKKPIRPMFGSPKGYLFNQFI
jgi:hypothetical protein